MLATMSLNQKKLLVLRKVPDLLQEVVQRKYQTGSVQELRRTTTRRYQSTWMLQRH